MLDIPGSPHRQPALSRADPCEGNACSAEAEIPRWLCVSCDCTYCDRCWEQQAPHRQGKLGQLGLPHEKTSKDVFERLKTVFESPERKSELLRLHLEDEETFWFGIEKDKNGKYKFYENGRYNNLMTMTKQPTATERYPLLVSFVGQTGAGKSTLIKLLVSLKESNLNQAIDDLFKIPVSGSVKDDRSPTSGDVHLYIDPQTAFSDLPMLYADCEGLEGGEVPPRAKTIMKGFINKPETYYNGTAREMKLPTEKVQTGHREHAVRNVYPRLLYTFSDVIVFVLRNTRTFESVALKLLLEWASSSMECSVNQPALPQAIIVLNSSDASMDEEEWDVKTATERLMEHVKYAIYSEPIKKYADSWAKRGKMVKSSEELIKCYYANVTVVRIPGKGRNMLIKKQVDQLHLELSWACQASFKAKWEARQSCTTEELNRYLQAAFDHFASKPDQPFNFVDVALKADPIPQSFAERIVHLALAISSRDDSGYVTKAREVFRRLSPMVASYILLDCTRYKRPGKPEDLFDQHYASSCSTAIKSYYNRFIRCGFTSRKGRQCVNSSLYHEKGHQSWTGSIIGAGSFKSLTDVENIHSNWLELTRGFLVAIEALVREGRAEAGTSASREKATYELHRQNLLTFFGDESAPTAGHHSCYGCLMEPPQHPLSCKHMLCTLCVKMLGHVTDNDTVTIDSCPFESRATRAISQCSIRFKPDFAGIRLLSLDGGGMRGIVELESLRAIEKVLGNGLPIQAFFDLVVGTSTGGIIALGLGVKQWTVDQCITRFIQLCGRAFTPRELDSVKILRPISLFAFRSRYKSKPLRKALMESFGRDPLYGHVPEDALVRDNKVCVTATSGTADSAIAIGNYTRQSEDEHWYKFQRGDKMQVWEVASATSAAPKYFKKFVIQSETSPRREYLDGALYFNNPVRIAFNERRFLWPDVADVPPDIVLSLGTGQHARVVASTVSNERSLRRAENSRELCMPEGKLAKLKGKMGNTNESRRKSVVKNVFEALSNMLDSILDAEREFRLFEADQSNTSTCDRFIRLNPDLQKEPPALDDVSQMLPLQEKVQKIFAKPSYELITERIAHRLVASSFYFVKDTGLEHDERTRFYTCRGRIACRFEGNANDKKDLMRHLGQFFRRQSTPNFRPYFLVKDISSGSESKQIELDRQTIDDMIADANFHGAEDMKVSISDKLSSTIIYLCLKPSRTSQPELYTISGFPRFLVTEDASTASRLQKRAELIKRKINKSELIVGDLLFDFLEITPHRSSTEQDVDPNPKLDANKETDPDAQTLIGSPKLKNASQTSLTSASSPRNSLQDESSSTPIDNAKTSSTSRLHNRRTSSQQSDPTAPGVSKSPQLKREILGNLVDRSVSIADFRSISSRKGSGYSRLSDVENDARPSADTLSLSRHASSDDVVVIDAVELMCEDQGTMIVHEGSEGEILVSTKEVGEKVMTAGEDTDSDGPPSDFEADKL